MDYNTLVIGAGPNGLATAALLAKAGRRVLVLEARREPGGLAAGETFCPGFRTSGIFHETRCLRPSVVKALGLTRRGLTFRKSPAPLYIPSSDGHSLSLGDRPPTVNSGLKHHSIHDVRALENWRGFVARVAPLVRRWLDRPALALDAPGRQLAVPALRAALGLRRLGADTVHELLRVLPMSVKDWLDENFECDLLKSALAGPSLMAGWANPYSAGTAANLLIHEATAGRAVVGGPAAVIASLLSACRDYGARIRTRASVTRILTEHDRAAGVVLEDGEEIKASCVVSSLDPRHTFFRLLPRQSLPPDLLSLEHWRSRGTTAHLALALAGSLEFRQHPAGSFEHVHVAESLDDLTRAFDPVKYRALPDRPWLDVRVPTFGDASLAPPGHHVLSILIHFVPNDLEGGWTPEKRETLFQTALRQLERYAPAVRDRLRGFQLLTPPDIEARYGITGGHLHHGEHALDQLFSLRPHPALSGHATPIPGLYLCGSSTHPGGSLTCGPAALAARRILAD